VALFFDTVCVQSNMKWYEKAKGLMVYKKIRQDDLLGVFGVTTRGAVGHYLTGRRQPGPAQMKALADKLGCSLDELMTEGEVNPLQLQINLIIRAAEKAMAMSSHQFTESERLGVYRAAFAAGLDMEVTYDQLTAYLGSFVRK